MPAAKSSVIPSLPSGPAGRAAEARDPTPWKVAPLPATVDLLAAEAWCRKVATRHYENFTVATRLVRPGLRQHLANVYAFARWSDDLADEAGSADDAARRLAEWRRGLDECFSGRPGHPVYVALAETIRQTGLTIEPFADLLSAFTEDQVFDRDRVVVRYPTRAALLRYCSRSADPVGRIVLALEGCRDAGLVAMSDAICTGLQLVNFWQDIRRDRQAGRVYLPAEDMGRHGVEPADLDAVRASTGVRALVRDEVAWARECFAAGAALAELAPRGLRPAIGMFVGGGRALADTIERLGYDTLGMRPVVSRWRKLRLAGRAWWQSLFIPQAGRS